jgi:16S rRNA (cytidine1402-2'-O)-methyltransferase
MDLGPAGAPAAPAAPALGLLLLAGAPIGDPQDASPRLARVLQEADLVAAEDTRRLARLTSALGLRIAGRVVSYHEHNEARRTPELLAALAAGQTVVVITDAGMPSVSDPGYRLVAAAAAAGVRISAAPGPSAVLTALAVSGLPVDRFCFEGFLPRKPGERARALSGLAAEPRTLVLFEAPHRLAAALAALAAAFGADRPAAVCRELTKTYEEVVRGGLGELADWAEAGPVRGEITVVVQGAPPPSAADPADLVGQVQALCDNGSGLKQAVATVAEQHGVVKRDLYAAALAAR